jgi:hypothetical protein
VQCEGGGGWRDGGPLLDDLTRASSDGGIVRPSVFFHQIASVLQVLQQLTQPFNLRYQKGDPTAPIDVVRVVLQPTQSPVLIVSRVLSSIRQNNLDT